MRLEQLMIFIGESFMIYYLITIPRIILFVLGILSLKKTTVYVNKTVLIVSLV